MFCLPDVNLFLLPSRGARLIRVRQLLPKLSFCLLECAILFQQKEKVQVLRKLNGGTVTMRYDRAFVWQC